MKGFVVALAAGALALPASALSAEKSFRAGFADLCRPMVTNLIEGQSLRVPFMQMGRSETQICACAEKTLFGHKTMAQLQVSPETMDPRLKADPNLKSFVLMKTGSAVFSCLATELDTLSADIDPLR